jgi:hypothetical protein
MVTYVKLPDGQVVERADGVASMLLAFTPGARLANMTEINAYVAALSSGDAQGAEQTDTSSGDAGRDPRRTPTSDPQR